MSKFSRLRRKSRHVIFLRSGSTSKSTTGPLQFCTRTAAVRVCLKIDPGPLQFCTRTAAVRVRLKILKSTPDHPGPLPDQNGEKPGPQRSGVAVRDYPGPPPLWAVRVFDQTVRYRTAAVRVRHPYFDMARFFLSSYTRCIFVL